MGSQSKPETNAAIRGGAVDILRQGETLLNSVDDDQYAQVVEPASRASIGAHYRHCLEHFQLLLDGANDGEVDYDRRQRDVLIETDRFAALNLTRDLIGRIEDLDDGALDGEIKAVSKVGYSDEASRRVNSSFARELMYAIAHGVHHYALIGVAPSTVAYQREKEREEACARPLNAASS